MGRFFEIRRSPEAVILRCAQDLHAALREIESSRLEPALREAKV